MKVLTLAAAVALLPACFTEGDDAAPPPPASTLAAHYDISTHIDVPVRAVLPEPADDALAILEGLRDAPGATMIRALDDAGVPLVADVFDVLPGAVRDRVTGWMDDEIRARIGSTEGFDAILVAAETTLAGFDLESSLTVTGASARHDLASVHFLVDGHAIAFTIPASELGSATCSASVSADGRAVLGAHGFGLAYGEYADRALDAALVARTGADLRGTLAQLVDCDAVAARVANRCVLGVCVGHATQLAALCEAGLDEAAVRVHEEIRALRLDALRIEAGEATLAPAALTDGVWDARLDAGQGLREVTATFTGAAR